MTSRLRSALFSFMFAATALSAQQVDGYYAIINQNTKTPISESIFRSAEETAYKNYTLPISYEILSNNFANTSEKAWAIIYAETYCQLVSNPETSKKQSHLIVDLLQNSIKSNRNQIYISLTKATEISEKGLSIEHIPFENNYEISFLVAALTNEIDWSNLNIAKLNKIRTVQLDLWVEKDLFKNDYTKRLLKIKAMGHFEAYNYWLFSTVFPDEFQTWVKSHSTEFAKWTEWLQKNPFVLKSNNFHRLNSNR